MGLNCLNLFADGITSGLPNLSIKLSVNLLLGILTAHSLFKVNDKGISFDLLFKTSVSGPGQNFLPKIEFSSSNLKNLLTIFKFEQ